MLTTNWGRTNIFQIKNDRVYRPVFCIKKIKRVLWKKKSLELSLLFWVLQD
jgi:hypothetical protein